MSVVVYEVRPRKDKRGVDLINERSAIRSAVVRHPTQARQFLCSVALIPAPETRGHKFQRVGARVCNGSHHRVDLFSSSSVRVVQSVHTEIDRLIFPEVICQFVAPSQIFTCHSFLSEGPE
jgi:hypothetical protein